MPFFSIIIPVYNREKYIAQCINSVLQQTFRDYEIIAIDDGSSDQSVAIIREFGDAVHLIQQTNAGPGAARNRGINVASGEFIIFLDSDDFWFPWTLQSIRQAIDQTPDVAVISIKFLEFRQESEIPNNLQTPLKTKVYSHYFQAASDGVLVGSGRLVGARKTVIVSVGGFIEEKINAEDHDLAFRFGNVGSFVDICDPVAVAIRKHDENVSADTLKLYFGILNLIKKEKANAYPGGNKLRRVRRAIITRHGTPVILELARNKQLKRAWALYIALFRWNLAGQRFKFLIAAPFLFLIGAVRK